MVSLKTIATLGGSFTREMAGTPVQKTGHPPKKLETVNDTHFPVSGSMFRPPQRRAKLSTHLGIFSGFPLGPPGTPWVPRAPPGSPRAPRQVPIAAQQGGGPFGSPGLRLHILDPPAIGAEKKDRAKVRGPLGVSEAFCFMRLCRLSLL